MDIRNHSSWKIPHLMPQNEAINHIRLKIEVFTVTESKRNQNARRNEII